MSAKEFSQTEIKDAVKSRYAKAIQGPSSCCGPSVPQEGPQSGSCCGPTTVEQKITDAEMAIAGDTATGATKKVITETGLQVTVPLFVNVGDTIRIDTRDKTYITRV